MPRFLPILGGALPGFYQVESGSNGKEGKENGHANHGNLGFKAAVFKGDFF